MVIVILCIFSQLSATHQLNTILFSPIYHSGGIFILKQLVIMKSVRNTKDTRSRGRGWIQIQLLPPYIYLNLPVSTPWSLNSPISTPKTTISTP